MGKDSEESDDGKKKKKKKGCISRLISLVVVVVIVFVVADILLDDDTEYISDQERGMAEDMEDLSLDELIDLFYEWYGYLPDDEEELYNFQHNEMYADYDADDYDNYDSSDADDDDDDYWDNYWDNYYESYNDYYNSSDDYEDYDDYRLQKLAEQEERQQQLWNEHIASNEKKGEGSSGSSSSASGGSGSSQSKPLSNASSSEKRKQFLAKANAYKGTPYDLGGLSHRGIDCSGLVYCAAREAGLGTLPRTARDMYSIAKRISMSDAIEGDLIFFASGGSVSHVAIYIGNNQVLHAVSDGPKTGVIVSKLSEKYWKNHFYAVGRIIS